MTSSVLAYAQHRAELAALEYLGVPATSVSHLQFASALAIVAAITLFYRRVFTVNQTTVALTFLLAILAVSTVWGFAVSAFMSVAAMLAFNYFFLPPVGTFTIADPQNWAALFAFLATSLIASQLATRVRREADEAQQRRKEIERLYAFSQQLLVSGNVITLLNAIPNHIVETFEVGAAALYLDYKQKFYHSGAAPHFNDEELKRATAREEPLRDAGRSLCLRARAHGNAPDRQPGHFRAAAFAADPGSAWLHDRHCL